MKAARLHEYCGRVSLDEIAEPAVEGPFDVLVRIAGAGLCRTDLHIIEGLLGLDVALPYTLGHENAGWVAEVGTRVTSVAAGDPVVVHPLMTCGLCRACRAGDDMHCGSSEFPGLTRDGGFAELLRTSERSLVKLDPGVDPKDVAAHADAGLAAYHAVKRAAAALHPGATAVVIGSGGLGHIAVQCLAAMTPAEIVVVDRSEAALELARDVGAHHAIRTADEQIQAEVVLDFVGEGDAVAEGVKMLRRAGTYYLVGYGGVLDVPTIDVIGNEISFVGNLVGSYNELAELIALAAQGRVRLQTTDYPLDAIGDAIADLDAGRVVGRAVVVP